MKFRSRFLLILALEISFPACALWAGVTEHAASAEASLRSGHPLEALTTYRSLLTSPQFATSGSREIWYNRGLAEEKTGDAAAASLSFRRALLLDPSFVPAQRQLAVVLGTLGLPVQNNWQVQVRGIIHPEKLIIGGAVVGWIGVLAVIALCFLVRSRKGWIAFALLLLVLGHGASIFGTMIDPRREAASQAIVTSKSAPTLRATPADNGTAAGTVPPGTLISVLSRNGAWWYVAAGPGQIGWIPSDTVTSLLPNPSVSSAKGF